MATLIEGPIEGPVRSRAEWKDRTCYTIINFEIRGKTMEMVGDPLPLHGNHDPVPPIFANGDAVSVAAYPLGDGLFKVAAMSVPSRQFFFGQSGQVYQVLMACSIFVSAFVLLRQGVTDAVADAHNLYPMILAMNLVCLSMVVATFRSSRAARMVRQAG